MNEDWSAPLLFKVLAVGLGLPAPFLALMVSYAESGHEAHPGVALIILWGCIELVWTFVRLDRAAETPIDAARRRSFGKGVLLLAGSAVSLGFVLPSFFSYTRATPLGFPVNFQLLIPYGLAIVASRLCRTALAPAPDDETTAL